MLNAVIRLSLRHRGLVVFLSLAVLIYGGYVTANLPIDVFPDLDRPRVVLMTEAPGLAPEEVETLVTFPLESAILGATGVEAVRSQSGLGLSVVYVEFGWGADIRVARQVVQERLTAAEASLPEGVHPQMAPVSSIMGQILHVGLSRRPGPTGGELASVGKTGLVAELVHDGREGTVSLRLWKPVERDDPDTWQPVTPDAEPIALVRTEADGRAVGPALTLRPGPDGTFTASDASLQNTEGAFFTDLDRKLTLSVGGRRVEVVVPSFGRQQLELRTTADWVVRPALLKLSGIAQVMVMGGGRKQYQVLVDPTKLLAQDVTMQQVEAALRNNNVNASGGYAVRGDREQVIRVLGRLGPDAESVVKELRELPVRVTPERTVKLGQVARVVEGAQAKRGDASVNGLPAVVMMVTKQPHADTRDLTDRVTAVLRETEQSLPVEMVANPGLFRLKNFIDRGVYNVGEALVIGAMLVLIILFLFLLNFRTTFISLTAIPLSLVITALVFQGVGWVTGVALSINVMTLGGIAVAMGELVDDAIVDVENIFRRLRENNLSPTPRPPLQVIYEASIEVRSAIVFGTAMVILVFIPLFALSGVEGRLFTPLGVAYIVSILASLLVSLTVTPVLSYYLLPQARATHRAQDSPLLRALKWGASYLVRFSMSYAGLILLLTWMLVGLCAWKLATTGGRFLPEFDEGSVQINVTLPPGSSLQASNEVAVAIDAKLRQMQKSRQNPTGEILQFSRRSGRAEMDEHAEPVSNTEYLLTTNPESGRSREEILEQLQTELTEEIPGVDLEVEQPLSHLISHMLSGVTAQIAIKIHGDDLDMLQRLAAEVTREIADVPGITPPVPEPIRRVEELHVRLRPEQLARHGVDRAYVADFVTAALRGETISEVVEGQRRFDLILRLDEPYWSDHGNLARLHLDLPDGRGRVALGDLATIDQGSGANEVKRENVRRRIAVRVNARQRDLTSVVDDIKKRVERLKERKQRDGSWPAGYTVEYGGQFESLRRATLLILVMALASGVGMFVVLYMLYPSARVVLQIMNALPAAFVGGVAALVLTEQSLSVASMVGFISLGGIAVRNGILLVTHYFHLMKYEGEGFTEKMVLRGSLERLAPVLMTALTAGIGLLPLVIDGQKPGREILYPVATVILGGLITSTLCEFLIHPGLFWRFTGKDAERLTHAAEADDALLGSP